MAKKKETTFEQYMRAKEIEDKKLHAFEKADQRRYDILSRMPDCDTKLFKYNGTQYVVTKISPRSGWHSHKIEIREVQR